MDGYYAGRPKDGEGHTMDIDGQSWTWNASKYLNNKFKFIPVGQGFTADGSVEEGVLTLEWSTMEFTDMVEDVEPKYIISNAMGKKARTIKISQKKVDNDNFRALTIGELREHMLYSTKSQQAALMAQVMAHLGA